MLTFKSLEILLSNEDMRCIHRQNRLICLQRYHDFQLFKMAAVRDLGFLSSNFYVPLLPRANMHQRNKL